MIQYKGTNTAQRTMPIKTAQAILNNPEYGSAYAELIRRPTDISEELYTKAIDWLQATLVVSAHQR